MDEFKVGDIVKTIRQSYGVNFSEAVVIGRHRNYICVIAKTRHGYNDWWVDPKDIIKTKQELLDDRDLELAKIVSTICYDEMMPNPMNLVYGMKLVLMLYTMTLYMLGLEAKRRLYSKQNPMMFLIG